MGIEKEGWLHAAESLHHDIGPANELGIASVWVNRGHDNTGGATLPSGAKPDMEVRTLAELVGAMGLE